MPPQPLPRPRPFRSSGRENHGASARPTISGIVARNWPMRSMICHGSTILSRIIRRPRLSPWDRPASSSARGEAMSSIIRTPEVQQAGISMPDCRTLDVVDPCRFAIAPANRRLSRRSETTLARLSKQFGGGRRKRIFLFLNRTLVSDHLSTLRCRNEAAKRRPNIAIAWSKRPCYGPFWAKSRRTKRIAWDR